MDKRERILEVINEMTHSELVYLHNEYCYNTNTFDDVIEHIDNIDELCSGQDAYWIACRVFYGDFNPTNSYIKFDGYGNFQSISSYNITDEIYIEDIADYIVDNDDSLCNDEIQEVLDEYNAIEERAEQEECAECE